MPSAIEVTKREFYSQSHRKSEVEEIPIESARFETYVDLLDECGHFYNPVSSRGKGKFGTKNWSISGHSVNSIQEEGDVDDDVEDVGHSLLKFEYVLFNGFFSTTYKLTRATKQDLRKAVNETVAFIEKSLSHDFVNDFDEVLELQEFLAERCDSNRLDRIDICILTDKIIEPSNDELKTTVFIDSANLECRVHYWDLQRWDALKRSSSRREPINIDFVSGEYSIYDVPFLKKKTGKELDYILSIFPGDLIADLYDYHNTRLLENNVRVFLSATRKANRGIRETIGLGNNGQYAHRFFSYNNGISATAENVHVAQGKILKIEDFQIVNGGQTTATIHYSRRKDKLSLSEVFVAVKITALRKDATYTEVVDKISKAANTQSSIKGSDFYANDPQLVVLENIAKTTPSQNAQNRDVFYFFERMSGQYKVTKEGQGTERHKKIWMRSNPEKLMFTKQELAKWSNSLHGYPYIAAAGAEKQFKTFMEGVHFERKDFCENNFKTLIGFGLMFNRIYTLCGKANGKKHLYPSRTIDRQIGAHVPVAMSTALYTAAIAHRVTHGLLDYWGFFDFNWGLAEAVITPTEGSGNNKQRVRSELDSLFEELIDMVWKAIAKFGGAAAQEKTKKVECWQFVLANCSLPGELETEFKRFMISPQEKKRRDSSGKANEEGGYFESLQEIIGDGGCMLSNLHGIARRDSLLTAERNLISNFISKLNDGDKPLQQSKLTRLMVVYENLVIEGYENLHIGGQQLFADHLDLDNIANTLDQLTQGLLNDNSGVIFAIAKEFKDNHSLSLNDLRKTQEFINSLNGRLGEA